MAVESKRPGVNGGDFLEIHFNVFYLNEREIAFNYLPVCMETDEAFAFSDEEVSLMTSSEYTG